MYLVWFVLIFGKVQCVRTVRTNMFKKPIYSCCCCSMSHVTNNMIKSWSFTDWVKRERERERERELTTQFRISRPDNKMSTTDWTNHAASNTSKIVYTFLRSVRLVQGTGNSHETNRKSYRDRSILIDNREIAFKSTTIENKKKRGLPTQTEADLREEKKVARTWKRTWSQVCFSCVRSFLCVIIFSLSLSLSLSLSDAVFRFVFVLLMIGSSFGVSAHTGMTGFHAKIWLEKTRFRSTRNTWVANIENAD